MAVTQFVDRRWWWGAYRLGFLRLLNANRVDYLLVGGYAVGLHVYPRAIVDLDLAGLDNLP